MPGPGTGAEVGIVLRDEFVGQPRGVLAVAATELHDPAQRALLLATIAFHDLAVEAATTARLQAEHTGALRLLRAVDPLIEREVIDVALCTYSDERHLRHPRLVRPAGVLFVGA